ncbi:glycoside hydrolase family 31 protein [Butyrivibrio sp. WCD3002]|uniref:glycoside hydrolase family 31 protein n=1 Tax=Butyrivibrio sp. WCD3002 TaxID=1280676 RepID=UPI000409AC30|nr:glycoside hydrolase family 31 protein [Butyrivibrio sp. WCD3002]
MQTFKLDAICPQENIIQGAGYRISLLTDSLLRLEYEKDGHFTDNATQTVLNRDFPKVDYEILEDTEEKLVFKTARLKVTYDKKFFTSMGLSIELLEEKVTWHFGEVGRNLLGTVRTLDETNGIILYGHGLISRDGYAWFMDGDSCELEGEEIKDREYPEEDVYFFGYGNDYYRTLKDFYYLCGKTPMIPRYALGNWWSKYEKYTEESYLALMDKFEEEKVPISVAVIDMDWHITEIDEKYGTGWTGYTWNKEYFPDYRRFLKTLKERGKAITLNLHPADGIRAFEECYERVAKRMGVDMENEEPVSFDLMDPKFVDTYFEEVMHPYEDEGVDFWWIDWQQGTKARQGNVDPLWILNHYHYLDQLRRGKRAMIFSRYAGVGSHRYPIGFSGDAYATWTSLNVQPFFTSTASNVGYGWWSHDIGGHMHGEEDTERTCRWVQFGVFSPIMRLHSSSNPFFFKEPWNLPQPMRSVVDDYMRLRHRMVPYLYTEGYKAWNRDVPVIRPLYYDSPDVQGAYESRNGYYFGSEMIAFPITEKLDPELRMAHVHAFIPKGRWIDIMGGNIYEGEEIRNLYRPIENIPVLIKEGGIVPMDSEASEDINKCPEALDIYLGVGADGEYELFEDDGISNAYADGTGALTRITQKYDAASKKLTVEILPATGNTELVPAKRQISLVLCGVEEGANVSGAGVASCYDAERRQARIEGITYNSGEKTTVVIENVCLSGMQRVDELYRLLKRCEISYDLKEVLYHKLQEENLDKTAYIRSLDVKENLKDALLEIIA